MGNNQVRTMGGARGMSNGMAGPEVGPALRLIFKTGVSLGCSPTHTQAHFKTDQETSIRTRCG